MLYLIISRLRCWDFYDIVDYENFMKTSTFTLKSVNEYKQSRWVFRELSIINDGSFYLFLQKSSMIEIW